MKSRKKLLRGSRLYVLIDKVISGKKSVIEIARKIKDNGADIVQLRDKISKKERTLQDAFLMRKLFSNTNTLFIINDYLDIAKIADCDGLHIGQEDIPIGIARRILGEDKIIGVSCHSIKQALEAQDRGADYIGIGPIFPTPAKSGYKSIGLDLIGVLRKKMRIPFFVIGNVNLKNIDRVKKSGAHRVAVCRAVLEAKIFPSLQGIFPGY
jgi:thiamine-phosphate pyrophosphorylase